MAAADGDPGFFFPGGSVNTMSWDLLQFLVERWSLDPDTHTPEDVLLGKLMHEASPIRQEISDRLNLVDLPWDVVFDLKPNTLNELELEHDVCEGAIVVHKMKTDEWYKRVADMFDADGLLLEGAAKC